MRSFATKLYLIYITVVIVIFGAFAVAYTLIADNYVSNASCNTLALMNRETVVEINQQVLKDYVKFCSIVDGANSNDVNIIYGYVSSKTMSIDGVTTYQYGYIQDEKLYTDDKSYNIFKNDIYFNNSVGIYRLNEILTNYPNKDVYVVFRYKDVIIYFDCASYLNSFIKDVDGMPDNYFMIISSDGDIVYQENPDMGDRIYSIISTTIDDSQYQEFLENLKDTGYDTLSFNGEKSYLVHTPILESLSKNTNKDETFNAYSLVYIFTKKDVIASASYLTTALLISFITVFVVINAGLLVAFIFFIKKEQDMSSSKLRYFFAKPYIMTINKKGRIRSFNKTCHEAIPDLKKYKYIFDFDFYDASDDILKQIRIQKSLTINTKNKDDKQLYIRFIPLKILNGYLLLGEDVTEPLSETIRNNKIALYNSVTNLPNKILLERALDEIVANKRTDAYGNVLVAIDVIDFVKINKMFGFGSGDRLLKDVRDILNKSVENYKAVVYNIRTSLFMILFYEEKDFNKIVEWSKEAIKELSKPMEIKDNYLTLVEVKMGIYNIPKDQDVTTSKIYDCANNALERAKASRLIKCATYNSEFGQMMSRDQIMEEDLLTAINERAFMMFFQPQYNTKRGKIVGFEALVRWNNPKYQYESPETYIKMAEKNGMIIDLGNIIIEETFKFAKRIESTGIHISMNVSPAQLLHSGFINLLIQYFEHYQLQPGSIAIEITETFLMENSEVMIEKLRILKDKGFSIHLDDFGIGYSSMLYLKDLPVDTIKIDKEFVKNFTNDKFSKAIVTRIVQLALGLDLQLVAEGVENEKQMNALSKIGCDVIQGYLISKPVNENLTIDLIRKYNGTFTFDSDENVEKRIEQADPNFVKPIASSVKKKLEAMKKEKEEKEEKEENNPSSEA